MPAYLQHTGPLVILNCFFFFFVHQVTFDGWTSTFDFFCHYKSPEVQPVGTCQQLGIHITGPSSRLRPIDQPANLPPNVRNLKEAWVQGGLDWQGYLSIIGGSAVPKEVFPSHAHPERPEGVHPLHEVCVRKFLSSLSKHAVDTLVSSEWFSSFPRAVREQLTSARR